MRGATADGDIANHPTMLSWLGDVIAVRHIKPKEPAGLQWELQMGERGMDIEPQKNARGKKDIVAAISQITGLVGEMRHIWPAWL